VATLTVVITYSGTAPQEEVTSYTSAGTAFSSLTATELATTSRLMRRAVKRTTSSYGSKVHPGGGN
jgi:hypothetical protein